MMEITCFPKFIRPHARAEDLTRARAAKEGVDGALARVVAAAGATEDEHRILKDLLVGECAKGW
jgi:hypothetical protein